MHGEAITTMVVDDDPEFRNLVVALLRHGPFRLQAPDLGQWVEDACVSRPDVLLLDLNLGPGLDAVEHIPRIAAACPATMVGAMTGEPAEEMEDVTKRAGAFVFYEKATVKQLPTFLIEDLALFRRALKGEDVVAPAARQRRGADATRTVSSLGH